MLLSSFYSPQQPCFYVWLTKPGHVPNKTMDSVLGCPLPGQDTTEYLDNAEVQISPCWMEQNIMSQCCSFEFRLEKRGV